MIQFLVKWCQVQETVRTHSLNQQLFWTDEQAVWSVRKTQCDYSSVFHFHHFVEILKKKKSKCNKSVMGWQWGQCPWKRFPYIQVSDVLCYKPTPIIYRTLLLQNSLKVIMLTTAWKNWFSSSILTKQSLTLVIHWQTGVCKIFFPFPNASG